MATEKFGGELQGLSGGRSGPGNQRPAEVWPHQPAGQGRGRQDLIATTWAHPGLPSCQLGNLAVVLTDLRERGV